MTAPALWALQRLLHLHRLEHHDQVALGDGVAVGHRDLDDGALHRARSARRPPAAAPACWRRRSAGAGRPRRRGRRPYRGRSRPGRRDLEPLAADLDHDGLARGRLPRPARPRRRTAGRSLSNSVSIQRVCTVNGSAVKAGSRTTARWNGSAVAMPVDDHLVQRPAGPLQRLGAGLAGDDQLGQQRVELAADHRAGLDAGVDPHARAGRLAVAR